MSACITPEQWEESEKRRKDQDFYRDQIEKLANFILKEYPDEPGRYGTEGAIECAIRILKTQKPS